jgi:hypothetical protein
MRHAAAAVALTANELYADIVGGGRSSSSSSSSSSSAASDVIALLFSQPNAPLFRSVAFATLSVPSVFCTGLRAILRGDRKLTTVVNRAVFQGFCFDFIKAMNQRGGGGEEFVSAAALWIGLKESGGGGAWDVSAELALCGDAGGVMTCLRWLTGRTGAACGARVKRMVDRCIVEPPR